jgi:4-hydroxybenzoate polyprenyltransferase
VNGDLRTVGALFISIYFLELVGASAITALGVVACRILGLDWSRSAPLWFAGYLLVYNADRLYSDPADATNTPLRSQWSARMRSWRVALVWFSGVILVVWPVVTVRVWMLFPIAAVFGVLCFYSRPIPKTRVRLKDLPYLKSLLAPAMIAVILVLWPALESGKLGQQGVWLVFVWIFLILTINALIFDYRDIVGDKLVGTKTIPVFLGPNGTQGLLVLLAAALIGTSMRLAWLRLAGPLMPILLTLGCAGLLRSLKYQIPPLFLSLLADFLLFLPALGEWLN